MSTLATTRGYSALSTRARSLPPRTARLIGFVEEDQRLWRAVVKVTESGSETYLVSLHRAQARNLTGARHNLKKIRGLGE